MRSMRCFCDRRNTLMLIATHSFMSAADCSALLPHLLQFTEEHRAEAASLENELHDFAQELHGAVEEIWKKALEGEEGGTESSAPSADSWAARMEAYEKRKTVNVVDNIVKPELAKQEWKLKLPDVK